ncbi:protein phtf-like isoform X2 [Macrosteles quadrilineatus]|uniref:protein phtf-like isoform X2 n=1 Tax=Macrosteles quadrilineatus TaxID=74068 RepID=UPI0023E11247|nr:protein phtf-like isoform X2 [Macrosteles quadrilineatus]
MGCSLQDIVSWYQKKIGTYDKQPWEKTVEQHILSGFTPIPKKTAKLKTELIDIDLIRGSSFTKAKPKHGLMTVTRLAVMRLVFLPFHSQWWAQQTSYFVFSGLLLLYTLQIINMVLYFYVCPPHSENDEIERVNLSEVLVPLAMMFGLSIIHSQIVSPHSCVSQCTTGRRARRAKRSKRRPPPLQRYRSNIGSDSKSSPDTGPELTTNQSNKYRKRVRLRNVSPEDAFNRNKKPQPPLAEGKEPPLCEELRSSASEKEVRIIEPLCGRPSQEDDGFESLNGNGSSDNNEEDKSGEGETPAPETPESPEAPVMEGEGVLNSSLSHNSSFTCTSSDHPSGCTGEVDETDHKDTDSEPSRPRSAISSQKLLSRRRGSLQTLSVKLAESSYNSSGESDGETVPDTATSAAEWIGVTTNSEECSYSSELDERETTSLHDVNDHPFAWEFQISPAAILSPSCASSDKVSCTMWDKRDVKKAELSVLDISSAIIARVESMPENLDYFYGGLIASLLLAAIPSLWRLSAGVSDGSTGVTLNMTSLLSSFTLSDSLDLAMHSAFGSSHSERIITSIAMMEKFALGAIFFFLLAVAERTFKQRFLYAKFFSHLTSFRRARKSELPHFRLNKVRNIKTWLSVRSYLKKRGPQRSVDVVVSAAFIITLLLLSFLSVELLKDSEQLRSVYNVEALGWCLVMGVFLLRFMTLGTKINRKYRNLSVLITEQINLYLQIEQKPNKKEELMVANSVLKLAADLLKELESPFKISGLSANPYLYTITKVVILSALSGVLSEMLGFKLKLHKIKIK